MDCDRVSELGDWAMSCSQFSKESFFGVIMNVRRLNVAMKITRNSPVFN